MLASVNTAKNTQPPRGDALICTVDVVLLTLRDGQLEVLLLTREREPFAGGLALPGGYVHPQEDQDCEDAARRVLAHKLGLSSPYLEQLASFSGPARDPRGWSISVAYVALVPPPTTPLPFGQWRAVQRLPQLPFDHGRIVAAAVERVRNKSQYSSLPVHLCPDTFTLPDLHAVYEALMGEPINPVSFRRKMDELAIIEAIPGAKRADGPHRPAQLFRVKPAQRLALGLLGRGINSG
jgi:8-oxo-dGTP diphosphatase